MNGQDARARAGPRYRRDGGNAAAYDDAERPEPELSAATAGP